MSFILDINKFKSMANAFPELGRLKQYPKTIMNWDIADDNTLVPRDRYSRVAAIANPHSFYQDEEYKLFRADTSLYKLNEDNSYTPLKTGFFEGLPLDYEEVNGDIYFSDGITSGVVRRQEVLSWGIEVPPPPMLDALPSGYLKEGTYRVKVTYLDSAGNESGLSPYDEIEVPEKGGFKITVPNSLNPRVDRINYYVTDGGRYTFYGYTYQDKGSVTELDYIKNHTGRELPLTEGLSPIPAGHKITYFSSRLCSAVYNAIFFTEPFSYELCNLQNNFVQLPEYINNFIAIDKLLIASTKKEIYVIDRDWVASIGYKGSIISNSAVVVDSSIVNDNWFGLGVVMASEEGLLFVLGDGRVVNLSGKVFNFKGLSSATSACLREGKRYVVNMN